MKKLIGIALLAIGFSIVGGACVVAPIDPCPGQEVCGNGCMPQGSDCCGGGTYCDPGLSCAGNVCVSSYTRPVSGCLAQGMESCPNADGTIGCAPLGAACCFNGRYCPSGTVCGGSCGQECCQ